jgi:hypothetical protein
MRYQTGFPVKGLRRNRAEVMTDNKILRAWRKFIIMYYLDFNIKEFQIMSFKLQTIKLN